MPIEYDFILVLMDLYKLFEDIFSISTPFALKKKNSILKMYAGSSVNQVW